MKKLLSIILAILMVVTTVPFAFAAECDGEHGSSIQTCIGKICLTCRTPYGEKDVNAHYWQWGYCNYCSEKFPDDLECSHKLSGGGICGYCANIDEDSEKLLIDECMETGTILDAFSIRMYFYEIVYGASKVNEVYKSINEEYANLRKTREDRFWALDLSATVGESKAAIEALWAEDHKLADMLKNCLDGVHNVDEYTSNNDATCIANGTKSGDCIFCSATDITVEDEGTMLDSCYTNDGDTYCDGCGVQILCEDCGRPVHGDGFIQNLVCFIVMFFNLVKTAF